MCSSCKLELQVYFSDGFEPSLINGNRIESKEASKRKTDKHTEYMLFFMFLSLAYALYFNVWILLKQQHKKNGFAWNGFFPVFHLFSTQVAK